MASRWLDHGLIGNGRLLALVAPTGSIDWLCMPTFSSPSIFARLLGEENGGSFRIFPEDGEFAGRMDYLPNTNVLVTTFERGEDAWELVDFAPRRPAGLDVQVPVEIIRIVRPLRGRPRLRVEFDPRPDYARAAMEYSSEGSGLVGRGGGVKLTLCSNVPMPTILERRTFLLDRPVFFVLAHGALDEARPLAAVNQDLELTVAGWRAWAKTCALPLFAPREVLRSALCLKLHACHDTGAIIAATTTSIPEALGTGRTWDYRYCWLRDAAFVVEALRRLSHLHEGECFLHFLREVAEGGPLQPVYGITGERDLEEEILPHLAGFRGEGPVRIGNAAARQSQNDLMGEMMLCLETLLGDPRLAGGDPRRDMPLIKRLVEKAIARAPTEDTGLWEYRSVMRHHTFSRAMCWAAVDRGAVLASELGDAGQAAAWHAVAAAERERILEQAYNQELGFFTQTLRGSHPDASNLLLPSMGLVDAHDPRFVSTVEAYDRLLNRGDGLMLRYRNADDFGVPTSAFTICGFWMAEALALIGRLDEAVERFHTLLQFANPIGLFSEDVDPVSRERLGNFPQAYTHVGLINAAVTIGELLDARDGRVRAWV